MTLQSINIKSSSNLFEVDVFLLPVLVTGPNFMWISWLILKLWQILFIKYWTEISKSEITLFEFCPISGDWSEIEIPKWNVERMALIKSYWIMQNASVTAFTISELLRENKQAGGKITPSTQIWVNNS